MLCHYCLLDSLMVCERFVRITEDESLKPSGLPSHCQTRVSKFRKKIYFAIEGRLLL